MIPLWFGCYGCWDEGCHLCRPEPTWEKDPGHLAWWADRLGALSAAVLAAEPEGQRPPPRAAGLEMVEAACAGCGKAFELSRTSLGWRRSQNATGKLYCSRRCSGRAGASSCGRRPAAYAEALCCGCGEPFRIRASELRRRMKRRSGLVFCGYLCCARHMARARRENAAKLDAQWEKRRGRPG